MESSLFDFEEVKKHENFGIKIFHNSIFKGIMIDNSRNGAGVMIYHNGRVFEGQWMSDKRQGMGYERYSNHNKYEGMFEKG